MEKENFTIGVIISTYNNPAWLEKTLWGYINQTRKADEIIIADDGSGEETRLLIGRYASELPLRHVWHEDNGFRKTEILNKALAEATADYLIFTDQDCVPRADFIASHAKHAQKGYFLSGGMYRLPMELSLKVSRKDIENGDLFSVCWLRRHGVKLSWRLTKLQKSPVIAAILNAVTPTKATWNGCNASVWRETALEVAGFDERMKYGGEDREFGERMFNMGIKSKQLRYSLAIVHLDHNRPYKNDADIKANDAIRRETKRTRRIKTEFGIGRTDK